MKTKKLLAILLAAILVIALVSGCSSAAENDKEPSTTASVGEKDAENASESAAAAEPTTLRMAISSDPSSLAPYGASGPRLVPCNIIYEMLAKTNVNGELENWIAKDIVSKGNGVYEVEIYDYVTDSQGNHIDASDVVFSYDTFIEDGKGAQYVAGLESYRAIDDTHIEFVMSQEAPGGFGLMLSNVRIVSKAAWDASPDAMVTTPVGTAHYVLEEYVPGSHITYTKRDDYWQTDESKLCSFAQANIDTVEISIITDTSTQAIALENGEIDLSAYLATADLGNFIDMDTLDPLDGYTAAYKQANVFYQLIFNCGDQSVCNDINLRKAIAYCIDRQAVASVYWGSLGVPAICDTSTICFDYDEDYANEHQPFYEYNPELAQEYLAQSDYNGEPIRFLAVSSLGVKDAATLIASYMDAIGINVELMCYDNALFSEYDADNTGEKYDLELYGSAATAGYSWNVFRILDNNNYSNGINHAQANDPKVQELYDTLASMDTYGFEATNAMLEYLQETCYVSAIYGRIGATIARSNVTNLYFDTSGNLIAGACTISQ